MRNKNVAIECGLLSKYLTVYFKEDMTCGLVHFTSKIHEPKAAAVNNNFNLGQNC